MKNSVSHAKCYYVENIVVDNVKSLAKMTKITKIFHLLRFFRIYLSPLISSCFVR